MVKRFILNLNARHTIHDVRHLTTQCRVDDIRRKAEISDEEYASGGVGTWASWPCRYCMPSELPR